MAFWSILYLKKIPHGFQKVLTVFWSLLKISFIFRNVFWHLKLIFRFPYEVETAYLDVCRAFRRSKKANLHRWPKTLEEAVEAVAKIEKRFKSEVKGIGGGDGVEDTDEVIRNRELMAIEEDDEEEEDNRLVGILFFEKKSWKIFYRFFEL